MTTSQRLGPWFHNYDIFVSLFQTKPNVAMSYCDIQHDKVQEKSQKHYMVYLAQSKVFKGLLE